MPRNLEGRPGCNNLGPENEINVAAFFALRLLFDENVRDFSFFSNIQGVGDFDDLLAIVDLADGRRCKFAFQLKHAESGGYLQPLGFERPGDDFDLDKYERGYRLRTRPDLIDCRFILFTNRTLNLRYVNQMKKYTISASRDCPGRQLFNTSSDDANIYHFELVNDTDGEFFRKVSLYDNQKSWKGFKNLIVDLFKVKFDNEFAVVAYLDLIRNWQKHQYEGLELKMDTVKFWLIDLMLGPFSLKYLEMAPDWNPQYHLVQEAVNSFDLTIVEDLDFDFVFKYWKLNNVIDDVEILRAGKSNMLFTNVNHMTTEKKQKVLRCLGRLPFIVRYDAQSSKTVREVLWLYNRGSNNVKLLLLTCTPLVDIQDIRVRILCRFADLNAINRPIAQDILIHFQISLQGRSKIPLSDLYNYCPELVDILTMKELLLMLNQQHIFGESLEPLPDYYMNRTVLSSQINAQSLVQLQTGLIVISCNGQIRAVKNLFEKMLSNKTLLDPAKYLDAVNRSSCGSTRSRASNTKEMVILTNEIDLAKIIPQEVRVTQKVHHFSLVDDEDFEILSSDDIRELRQFKGKHNFRIDDEDLYRRLKNPVNVICARPGMGKSIMANYLKNQCPSDRWPIKINLHDHDAFFFKKREGKEILDYLLRDVASHYSYDPFEQKLMKIFAELKQILFIFDHLDEMRNNRWAVYAMRKLAAMGYCQWICSRTSLQAELEDAFNVFALDMEEFGLEQQKEYMRKRMRFTHSPRQINDIIDVFQGNVNRIVNNTVLGIPLQLYMITDVLMQKKCINDILVLTDMYRHFMEGKFLHYIKKKLGENCNSDAISGLIRDSKASRFEWYKKAALLAYFDGPIYDSFQIDCLPFLQEIKEEGDYLGVIDKVIEDRAVFNHNSYGEYFAACWFAEHRHVIKHTYFFDEKYRNIRFFFDMLIIGKDHPAHLAVLHKDLAQLKNHKSAINQKDSLGRTTLLLACTWGQRHQLLDRHLKFYDNVVDQEYISMVRYVAKRCQPYECDTLLGWSAVKYADRTLSLSALEGIAVWWDINWKKVVRFDKRSVLYHCVKNNYTNLFGKINRLCYVQINQRHNLLSLAVELDRFHFVGEMLKMRKYRKRINKNQLLHIAAQKGNTEIAETLMRHGAKVNRPRDVDDPTQTPMLAAVLNGHLDTVRLLKKRGSKVPVTNTQMMNLFSGAAEIGNLHLIECLVEIGADVNARDSLKDTPLVMAASKGHLDVVRFLVNAGAQIYKTDKYGNTPLMVAAFDGHQSTVEFLIYKGADVNTMNHHGYTALTLVVDRFLRHANGQTLSMDQIRRCRRALLLDAAKERNLEVVKFLVEGGADVNARDINGDTALSLAVANVDINMISFLLQNGAVFRDTNEIDRLERYGNSTVLRHLLNEWKMIGRRSDYGDMLLIDTAFRQMEAVSSVRVMNQDADSHESSTDDDDDDGDFLSRLFEIIKILVESRGADLNAIDANGKSALALAIVASHTDLVRYLLSKGADPNKTDKQGDSPLHHAVVCGNMEILDLLLAHELTIDEENRTGETALLKAASTGNLRIVLKLVEAGADVQSIDHLGNTALANASRRGDLQTVRYLVDKGVDDDNKAGNVVLRAVEGGHLETVQFLVEQGCDINYKNMYGKTPLSQAVEEGYFDIARYLIQNGARLPSITEVPQKLYDVMVQLSASNVLDAKEEDQLIESIRAGNLTAVIRLIEFGADVNQIDKEGRSALGNAARKMNVNMCSYLIDNGARIDLANNEHELRRAALTNSDFYRFLS